MKHCRAAARILSLLLIIALLTPFLPASNSSAQSLVQQNFLISSTLIQEQPNAPLSHGCGGDILPVISAEFEQEVVYLVNQERTSLGVAPFKRSTSLDEAARYHAYDLGQDDYFAHDSYDRQDGELVFVCSTWNRIHNYYDGASGENIAAGYTTPASVVAAWMDSPGHRYNILNSGSWEIGVGYFEGAGGYYTYWAQDFGRQDGVFPLIINNDAPATDAPQVSLYIYGLWSEMRLRNDQGAWTDWQPFENQVAWELPLQNGEHTVSVEMRDGAATASSQDTIVLNGYEAEPQLNDLPDKITFTYDVATGKVFPSNIHLTPENVGSMDALVWDIDSQGAWFSVSPGSGVSPESFTISPDLSVPHPDGAQEGSVTLVVTSPADTVGSPHQITVSMLVVSGTLQSVYIPLLINPLH